MRSLRQIALLLLLALLIAVPAEAKDCKKGKKLCGGKCISAKKVCKDAVPAGGEAGGEAGEAAGGEAAAPALVCKKGKKPCGGKCISAKKPCKEEPAATPGQAAGPPPKLASASSAEVAAALSSQAGQATLQLARVLQKSGDLDVDDKQRLAFKQALKGIKPPLSICAIGHVQLVRDCDTIIGGSVTLPCYLAVDEMSEICKLVGQIMPQVK